MIRDIITVGDLREKIKDIPDDTPVYIKSEDENLALLSIEKKFLHKDDYDDLEFQAFPALLLRVV